MGVGVGPAHPKHCPSCYVRTPVLHIAYAWSRSCVIPYGRYERTFTHILFRRQLHSFNKHCSLQWAIGLPTDSLSRCSGDPRHWFGYVPLVLQEIIVHLSSMFWLFTATRTFANTAETALTSIAMFYWPLSPSAVGQLTYAPHLRDFRKALFFAFLTVLLRPTSLVFWMGMGLLTLTYVGHRKQVLWHVVWEPLWIGYVTVH